MVESRDVGQSVGRQDDELDDRPELDEEQDELFTFRSGARIILFLGIAFLVLSVLCWLVGGPQQQ